MVTIKDTTLIKSFNAGDPMAFKVIFDRYYKILCSYTYHFIRTPYAVDDIVQDIFVALWNRREKFDCIEKISSFLFVSARNACLNHSKHEQMKAAKLKEFVAQTDEAVYDDYIIMAEFDQKLNHWLESLPTECRKIIDMSVSGMKNDEIAKALNISINTVKIRRSKDLKFSRNYIKMNILQSYFTFHITWCKIIYKKNISRIVR